MTCIAHCFATTPHCKSDNLYSLQQKLAIVDILQGDLWHLSPKSLCYRTVYLCCCAETDKSELWGTIKGRSTHIRQRPSHVQAPLIGLSHPAATRKANSRALRYISVMALNCHTRSCSTSAASHHLRLQLINVFLVQVIKVWVCQRFFCLIHTPHQQALKSQQPICQAWSGQADNHW